MFSALQALTTLHSLFRHPHAGREQIVAYRNDRVRRLIRHAYHHVPYYRHLFDRHHLSPEQIRSVEDLARIPITTRKDLQDLPVEDLVMRPVNPSSLIPSQSSGSSGCSITVRRSWCEERLHNAFRWRALLSYGLRPTDVHAYLILARPPKTQDNTLLHRVAQAIGLGRIIMISASNLPRRLRGN